MGYWAAFAEEMNMAFQHTAELPPKTRPLSVNQQAQDDLAISDAAIPASEKLNCRKNCSPASVDRNVSVIWHSVHADLLAGTMAKSRWVDMLPSLTRKEARRFSWWRRGQAYRQLVKFSDFELYSPAAPIIARMPALIALGNDGQASTTAANSGSK